jgi:hypothetical protein
MDIESVVNKSPFSGKNEDCKEAYKLLFTAIMKVIMPTKISKSYRCWVASHQARTELDVY